jgi:quercetin dioxygenase-like cupin family protein
MRAGTELREHDAPGPTSVRPLQGRFTLIIEGSEHEVASGTLVSLAGATRHAVCAVEDGDFLLTSPGAATSATGPHRTAA